MIDFLQMSLGERPSNPGSLFGDMGWMLLLIFLGIPLVLWAFTPEPGAAPALNRFISFLGVVFLLLMLLAAWITLA